VSGTLKASTRRVQAALEARGFDFKVHQFPESTRTSAEAAAAVGCGLGQIAKSLVFRAAESNRSVLVIASGPNRVDTRKIAALLGEKIARADAKIARADADFVRERTGFAIGGVPPVGHAQPPVVYIDSDLLTYPEIWSAAGTPKAVFPLTPADLVALTGGQLADIKAD
jgi:prolyl-tRNA editing enzyme YbaK/EbsC (Cys-tRNA(Pro) deacylase)